MTRDLPDHHFDIVIRDYEALAALYAILAEHEPEGTPEEPFDERDAICVALIQYAKTLRGK